MAEFDIKGKVSMTETGGGYVIKTFNDIGSAAENADKKVSAFGRHSKDQFGSLQKNVEEFLNAYLGLDKKRISEKDSLINMQKNAEEFMKKYLYKPPLSTTRAPWASIPRTKKYDYEGLREDGTAIPPEQITKNINEYDLKRFYDFKRTSDALSVSNRKISLNEELNAVKSAAKEEINIVKQTRVAELRELSSPKSAKGLGGIFRSIRGKDVREKKKEFETTNMYRDLGIPIVGEKEGTPKSETMKSQNEEIKTMENRSKVISMGFLKAGLGIMFFSMAMQKAIKGLMTPMLQISGIFELLSVLLLLIFMPIMEPLIKMVISLIDWWQTLDPILKNAIPVLLVIAYAFFSIILPLAQFITLLSAVKSITEFTTAVKILSSATALGGVGTAAATAATGTMTLTDMFALGAIKMIPFALELAVIVAGVWALYEIMKKVSDLDFRKTFYEVSGYGGFTAKEYDIDPITGKPVPHKEPVNKYGATIPQTGWEAPTGGAPSTFGEMYGSTKTATIKEKMIASNKKVEESNEKIGQSEIKKLNTSIEVSSETKQLLESTVSMYETEITNLEESIKNYDTSIYKTAGVTKESLIDMKNSLITNLSIAKSQLADMGISISNTFGGIESSAGDMVKSIASGAMSMGNTIKTAVGQTLTSLGEMWAAFDETKTKGGMYSTTWASGVARLNAWVAAGSMNTESGGAAVWKDLPKKAEGGIVTSPTMALIGESGPEMVLPQKYWGAVSGGTSKGITNNNVYNISIAALNDEGVRKLKQMLDERDRADLKRLALR